MATNDQIVVDGIIDTLLSERPNLGERGTAFECFALQQALKPYDLAWDHLESGWVDGGDDGGIDGFYVLVDGRCIDAAAAKGARRNAAIDVIIMTCKHRDSFQQAPLNSLLASAAEIFDFSKQASDLAGQYSADVRHARESFIDLYRTLALRQPSLRIHFYYASRGKTEGIAENVKARAEQLVALVRGFFSSAEVAFTFLGPTELVALFRQVPLFTLRLPFVEQLSHGGSNYVLLCTIFDYARFVTDENGCLRRYLFDSNVRDFAGDNRVNSDIQSTLEKGLDGADFWWLNNGITIIATNATVAGKEMTMDMVQIVNGLQTTEMIFRYALSQKASDCRAVLVKVLCASDKDVRDAIIRATNNQTAVQPAALHATEKLQRDIESVLERVGWYYERRTHYYDNSGKPASRIITPVSLAAAFVTFALRDPGAAAGIRNRAVTDEYTYRLIFSEAFDLRLYAKSAELIGRIEELLLEVRKDERFGRFSGRWRYLIAFLATGAVCRGFDYSDESLLALRPEQLTLKAVRDACEFVEERISKKPTLTPKQVARMQRNDGFIRSSVRGYATSHSLGLDSSVCNSDVIDRRMSERFIERVDKCLPKQPWKRNIHYAVANQLSAEPHLVQEAITRLIAAGRRFRQEDGIVYGADGEVLVRDTDR